MVSRHTLRKSFRTACRLLGPERLESLTIHHGRSTFISHALAGGRTLAKVRNAVGQAYVRFTTGYLHLAIATDWIAVWLTCDRLPPLAPFNYRLEGDDEKTPHLFLSMEKTDRQIAKVRSSATLRL